MSAFGPKGNSSYVNTINNNLRQSYIERDDPDFEPTEEDIREFARRIGINIVTESHLLDVARDGLKERLPNCWKPCYDEQKDAWYYYNKQSKVSQWEHPLNETYREKVIQTRENIAMNRIQSFDPLRKPLSKSLPPLGTLKKPGQGHGQGLGGARSALGPIGNTKSPLGLGDNFSHASSLQKPVKDGLGNLPSSSGNGFSYGNSSNYTSSNPSPSPQPQPQPQPRKLGLGLTLTGSGASFLKNNNEPDDDERETPTVGSTFDENGGSSKASVEDFVGGLGGIGREEKRDQPLKSILSNSSIKRGENKNRSSWDIDLNHLTEGEKKIWESLEGDNRKPSVKFNLDVNSELRFETSSIQDDDEEEEGEVKTENENTEEDDDDSEDSEGFEDQDQSDEKANEMAKKIDERTSNTLQRIPYTPRTQPPRPTTANKRFTNPPDENKLNGLGRISNNNSNESFINKEPEDPRNNFPFEKELETQKQEKKTEMANKLKEFESDIEKERKSREDSIRRHMDGTIEKLRRECEEKIYKARVDYDRKHNESVEKNRSDLDSQFNKEMEKMKSNLKKKIAEKENELTQDYEKSLNTMKAEIEENNKEKRQSMLEERKKEEVKVLEVELLNEIKRAKGALREEQRKQIQQMKDYHESILNKMKSDFTEEEERHRKEHEKHLTSLIESLKREREEKLKELKEENDLAIQKMQEEFNKKQNELKTAINKVPVPVPAAAIVSNDNSRDSKPMYTKRKYIESDLKKSPELIAKEKELNEVRNKLDKIEEKYSNLKRSLESSKQMKPSPDLVEVTEEEDDVTSISTSLAQVGDGNFNIGQMINGSHDRLNQALNALEVLKSQILDIKAEQDLGLGSRESREREEAMAKLNGKTGRSSNSNNKKHSHSNKQEMSAAAHANRLKSKSYEEFPPEIMINNNNNEKNAEDFVEDAKNFIKSQKFRLHNVKNNEKWMRKSSTKFLLPSEHLSETESSGVGSLGDNRLSFEVEGSTQINKDIDSILVSLKKLDSQMKYLWNVVGESTNALKSNPNIKQSSLQFLGTSSSSSKLNEILNSIGDGSHLHGLNRPSDLSIKYNNNYSPDTILQTASLNPILSSFEPQIRDYRNSIHSFIGSSTNSSFNLLNDSSHYTSPYNEKTKTLRSWLENI